MVKMTISLILDVISALLRGNQTMTVLSIENATIIHADINSNNKVPKATILHEL
jgi:hypothetical protein